ncbi:MAG: hypothetical protein HC898_05895 [Phycisphaerales bacterium]|nr:hypothetical protein [Phycisphaerales bacterium]
MDRSLELAQMFLKRAREDQHILQCLVRSPNVPLWGLGFHAQQAIENLSKPSLPTNV